MNKKVIYTAIFGDYDNLVEPTHKPDGWDFVCFTDNDLKSKNWEIRKTLPLYSDNTRTARKHKLLPHRFLPEYEYSLWVDGNIQVRDDVNELLSNLNDVNYATYNHLENKLDPRNCVYDEARAILQFGSINLKRHPEKGIKNFKDDPELILKQMERYQKDSYPSNNGLVVQMQVLRRHNEKDVIKTMESQWVELKHNSKREQLSFNYIAWKTNLKFNYISGDSRDNKYFLQMGKHKAKIKQINEDFAPINLDYFLNMEIAGGGDSKMIVRPEKIKTIKDMVEHWKNFENVKEVKSKLKPSNWQYYNCMMAGFKHDVENHHDVGWEELTEEYYNLKEDMTDEELTNFLKENPVEFENGFIKHSYHRACAMVGRLVNGKKYVPFYMKKDLIYDKPRERDGRYRAPSPIKNIKYIDLPQKMFGISPDEFTICQSGILTLMGIRQNDDLDIIISSKVRNDIFKGNESFMRFDGIEIFEKDKSKFLHFGAKNDDDLIKNYSFKVSGYNFLEPRFYFRKKRKDRDKDKKDWNVIKEFFKNDNQDGYPFNNLTEEKWGMQWV